MRFYKLTTIRNNLLCLLVIILLLHFTHPPLLFSKDGRDSYEKNLPLFVLISLKEAWDSNFINQFHYADGSLIRNPKYLNDYSASNELKSNYINTPELERFLNQNEHGMILMKGIHVPSLVEKTAISHVFGAMDSQNKFFKFGDLFASKLGPHFKLAHLYTSLPLPIKPHKTSPFGIDIYPWKKLEDKISIINSQKILEFPFLHAQYKEILGNASNDLQTIQRWQTYKHHDRISHFKELNDSIETIENTLVPSAPSNNFLNLSRYALSAMKAQHCIFTSLEFDFPNNSKFDDREKIEYFSSNLIQFTKDIKQLELEHRIYIIITAPYGKIWLHDPLKPEQKVSNLWPETSVIMLTPNSKLKYTIDYLNPQKLPKTVLEAQNSGTPLSGEGLMLDTQNTLNLPRIFSTTFKKLNAFDREIQGNLVDVKELKL